MRFITRQRRQTTTSIRSIAKKAQVAVAGKCLEVRDRAAFEPTELRPHSPNQPDAESPVFMRLCTICISRMELQDWPKRARFLSEPPPNRHQISGLPCTSVTCKTAFREPCG